MPTHFYTVLAILFILLAVGVALVNPALSLYIIGGVLAFGIGLLVYRILTNP